MNFTFDFENKRQKNKKSSRVKGIFGKCTSDECVLRNSLEIHEIRVGTRILRYCSNESPPETDLIPSVYEGGHKVWECTLDLLEYMSNNSEKFRGKCLELGCGVALPSILAALLGSEITLQDYNKDVLLKTSIPTIKLNGVKCDAFYGDWADCTFEAKFDFILSAETIYSVNNYDSLIDLVYNSLSDCGIFYLAAKSVYFGLDGSTESFIYYAKDKLKVIDRIMIKDLSVNREIILFRKECVFS